jgi:hypothetical protein
MSSLANASQDRGYKEPVFDLLANHIIEGILEKYPDTK